MEDHKVSKPKIMIFSFNHQAVRMSAIEKKSEDLTSSTFSIFDDGWTFYETHCPDFFDEVEKVINTYKPDVVVFGSQEDAIPGSYLHSHFLPKKMGDLYYNLQKRTRLMGLGVETYKAIKTFDLKLRGLRLSLYTKPHLTGIIELEERNMRDFLGGKGQLYANCSLPVLQSKGAVASYLKIPGIGPIAFVCAHLPFDADSLKQAYFNKDIHIRDRAIIHSNFSFNYLLQELIFNVKLEDFTKSLKCKSEYELEEECCNIEHVFFFGDLNYRVFSLEEGFENTFLGASKHVLRDIYETKDELHKELSKGQIFLNFKEGIDNTGPIFLPTCKMKKPRPRIDKITEITQLYNVGKGQRKPSWCDRILYCDRGDTKIQTKCLIYDRMDVGETMNMSDHAAVYGIYELGDTEYNDLTEERKKTRVD